MAARQPTPAELKEALSLLKQLKKGYADLGQENPFASVNADNIQDVITQAGGVKNILREWTLELDRVEDNLEDVGKSAKGLFQQFNSIVGELKKSNQNINIGAKSMSVFQKSAEKLKNDQQGITRLSKTELETLQRKNKEAASNLDIANKALQDQIDRGELEREELERARALIAEREEEASAIKDLIDLTEERLEKERKI
jgi:chromosome segregation ATPase